MGGEIQKELVREINSVVAEISTLAEQLMVQHGDTESTAFYTNTIAHLSRHCAFIARTHKDVAAQTQHMSTATKFYAQALDAANALPAIHPIRLSVYTSYSEFLFEFADGNDERLEAYNLGKKGFDAAIQFAQEHNKLTLTRDVDGALQLLKENLELWRFECTHPSNL